MSNMVNGDIPHASADERIKNLEREIELMNSGKVKAVTGLTVSGIVTAGLLSTMLFSAIVPIFRAFLALSFMLLFVSAIVTVVYLIMWLSHLSDEKYIAKYEKDIEAIKLERFRGE